MEKQSKFIKDFSKQESPEERALLSQEIREKKREYFEKNGEIETIEQEKSEAVAKIETLQNQIEAYNDAGFLTKIKDFFAIKKVQGELNAQIGKKSSIEQDLINSISGRGDLEETRKMVSDFYVKERKKWAEMPYSREEISQNFTEEHLTSLSMDDYATLLQRFPGEMLTHVTRHGIRDHADLGNHQTGVGEFHDTLYTVLEKKNLKSALGIKLQENCKEDAVANFLNLDACSTRNEALGKIRGNFDSQATGDPNAFADKSAIHLAVENVADSFYGSEKNNEVFFAFPSAFIASQYEFSGNLSKVDHNAYTDSYDNDQFVYPDIEKGLPNDAGIAFFPADAKVNMKTGSRYELSENKKTIPSEGIREILDARFGEQPGFVQFFVKYSDKLKEGTEQEKKEILEEISDAFGIKNSEAIAALMDFKLLAELVKNWGADDEKEEYGKILTKYFQKNGTPYKLTDNAISSMEYWENYFKQNPEQKPKHLVYYTGGNPAEALNEWRKGSGITKKDGKRDIGFPENEIPRNVKNADETQQRFVSIARSLVDKHFPITEKNPSYEYNWNG